MQGLKFIFPFLIFTGIFLSACDNNIEINAPYREIPVVNGIIDVDDADHYIRIEKVYQNSASITTGQGAKINDSLYFDSLVVKVYDINNPGNFTLFTPVTNIPKDSGFFSFAKNTLYHSVNLPIYKGTVALDIFHPSSGNHYYAKTNLVSGGKFNSWGGNVANFYTNDKNYINFIYQPGNNAYIYDFSVRLSYREFNVSNPSQYKDLYIDFPLERNYYASTLGSQYNNNSLRKLTWKDFLNYIAVNIPENPSVYRKFQSLDNVAYAGSVEFDELQQLSKPSLSIVQTNNEYSNIFLKNSDGSLVGNRAIGIFTSRNLIKDNKILGDSAYYYINKYAPNFQP